MTPSAVLRAVVAGTAIAACSKADVVATTEARRVVSLGPATTEALFAIGAGDRLVARSKYCDWPPEATQLPAVGGIEPDIEAVLELHPDLVVGPSGQWSARLTETMRAHGIATWFPEEIRSLAGVDGLILGLGARTGHADEAHRVAVRLDEHEAAVGLAIAGASKPRVLLVAGLAPVVVAGPDSFADDLVRRAGAVNVVTGGGAWPTLGFERVVELDPDVVLDASVAESQGSTRITAQAQGWAGVRAVRLGHVVALGDERILRPGPRIAEGLTVLARALHPEAAIP